MHPSGAADACTRVGWDSGAHIWDERHIPARFYAWASVIQDGRVVATDYAPDVGSWIQAVASAYRGRPLGR
jgi:hypothetical protein